MTSVTNRNRAGSTDRPQSDKSEPSFKQEARTHVTVHEGLETGRKAQAPATMLPGAVKDITPLQHTEADETGPSLKEDAETQATRSGNGLHREMQSPSASQPDVVNDSTTLLHTIRDRTPLTAKENPSGGDTTHDNGDVRHDSESHPHMESSPVTEQKLHQDSHQRPSSNTPNPTLPISSSQPDLKPPETHEMETVEKSVGVESVGRNGKQNSLVTSPTHRNLAESTVRSQSDNGESLSKEGGTPAAGNAEEVHTGIEKGGKMQSLPAMLPDAVKDSVTNQTPPNTLEDRSGVDSAHKTASTSRFSDDSQGHEHTASATEPSPADEKASSPEGHQSSVNTQEPTHIASSPPTELKSPDSVDKEAVDGPVGVVHGGTGGKYWITVTSFTN